MGCLITEEYKALNRQLHNENANYGASGEKRVRDVIKVAVDCDAKSILDYGCGKGGLKAKLGMPVREYDPAIAGKEDLPSPADLVVCSDVLEHVEPECLDSVLYHLKLLTKKVLYVVVHLQAAQKTLPDGRNAHLIQEDGHWWAVKLKHYFDVHYFHTNAREAYFVLLPKAWL